MMRACACASDVQRAIHLTLAVNPALFVFAHDFHDTCTVTRPIMNTLSIDKRQLAQLANSGSVGRPVVLAWKGKC
jgi:hypothetical protein